MRVKADKSWARLAQISSPTAWCQFCFKIQPLALHFTSTLFVAGVLLAHARPMPSVAEIESLFLGFIEKILSQLFVTWELHPSFQKTPGSADTLTSHTFWYRQLKLALKNIDALTMPKGQLLKLTRVKRSFAAVVPPSDEPRRGSLFLSIILDYICLYKWGCG
jgi:hypothetical protein